MSSKTALTTFLLLAAMLLRTGPELAAQDIGEPYSFPLKKRGIPFIQAYGPRVYGGHSQCWGMAQATDGTMYFGNGYGVLKYNGNDWTLIPLPSRSLVRSMDMGPGDTLYTGGVKDLGYIAKGKNGNSTYHSLVDLLPDSAKTFSQIRYTSVLGREVLYLDYKALMIWDIDEKAFRVLSAKSSFASLLQLDDEIFVSDLSFGLQLYNSETKKLEPMKGTEHLSKEPLRGIIRQGTGYLLSTDKDIYYYSPESQSLERFALTYKPKSLEYSGLIRLADGSMALRTSDNGLYIYDGTGKLELHLDGENGLANNHIHSSFIDNEGALWVTHNMGINRINLHMPFRIFDKRMGLTDIVNDVLRVKSKIFVSTHSGTFVFDENTPELNFRPVFSPNIESFALEYIDEQVMVSTSTGLYTINQVTLAHKLLESSFAYKFEQSEIDSSLVIFGATEGIKILKRTSSGAFETIDLSDKLPFAIRFMEQDEKGIFWIGTNDNKLVLIDFFNSGTLQKPAFKEFDQTHGLPVSQISPRLVGKVVYLNSQDGIFQLVGDTVIRSEAFSEVNTMVPYMEYDKESNVYLLAGHPPSMKIRRFEKDGDKYEEVSKPELEFLESNGLWISTQDFDGSYWISTTDGVLHYSPNDYVPSAEELTTQISSVSFGDSTVVRNVSSFSAEEGFAVPSFDYDHQSIRFQFSLPSFNNEDKTLYQYKLEGFDNAWSAWTKTYFKDYAGLREGSYTFRVRSRNLLGLSGKEVSYSFNIKPPWYRSWWFLIMSGLVFIGGGAYFVRYISTKALKRRVEELELEQKIQKERERISSDLHDHVGAQLTSIIAGLQITEQIEDFQFNPKVREIIDSLKEDASQTMTNLRDSIWSLHNKEVSVAEFSEHLDVYIRNKLRYFPSISFNLKVEGDMKIMLSPILALNVLRAIQEAFQNILKHAGATAINLSITNNGQVFELILEDNGVGFDNQVRPGEHYGVDNMSRRMNDIGGLIEILSKTGEGTSVKMSVPT